MLHCSITRRNLITRRREAIQLAIGAKNMLRTIQFIEGTLVVVSAFLAVIVAALTTNI
jgi:hypothetical protein